MLWFLLSWSCLAQTLSGIVVTGTFENTPGLGAPLEGVEIEVLGTSFVTTSNANGYFAFSDLPDGDYTLISSKVGYAVGRSTVRVRYAGVASHCQILMNPEGSQPRLPGATTAIPGGAVYVAYSKKYDSPTRSDEVSPFQLLAQKIAAAGGKLPGLHPEYGVASGALNNPICTADNYLMVYPPHSPNQASFLELPGQPSWLAFDPKGTYLYVTARQIPLIQIYNAASEHALVRNLDVGGMITELSVSGDGRYLLACVMGKQNGVSVVDTATNLPVRFLPTPAAPWAALRVGSRVFACSGTASAGEIYAFDLASATMVGRCPVGHLPTGLAATPDGVTLAVCCSGNACVSLVDTLDVKEIGRIGVGVNPKKLAISPDGGTCAVGNFGSDTVSLIDLKARAVKAEVRVGRQPLGITYDRKGKKIYVSCNQTGSIQILDGGMGTLLHTTVPMPHAVPVGLCVRP